MKCLVTGGAGFIGSNLAEYLADQGHEVVVLDSFATGKRENLEPIEGRHTLIEGDIQDDGAVRRAVAGCDAVFHQAALPSVPRSHKDPQTSSRVNVEGTMNVLTAARDAGAKRFVYASSSSVYGDSPTLPKDESMPPNPKSIYAVSKLAGEHYCRIFSKVFGLETVSLRYFNVFGPRQDPDSYYAGVIPKFVGMLSRGESPTVHGDGLQSRDFTYIDNVVQANYLAATVESVPQEAVVNVACGERYTLLDLLEGLKKELGVEAEPVFGESRTGDVKHSLASIERAKEILGYKVLKTFHEGLGPTVAYYKGRV